MMEAHLLQNHSGASLALAPLWISLKIWDGAQPRFLQTMTLILVVKTGRIFFHPFFISALAVLLVAPLLCDGEPNPSRGGRSGGGRGGGEYAIFAS